MKITGVIPACFYLIFLSTFSVSSMSSSDCSSDKIVAEGVYSLSNKWDKGRLRLEYLQQALDGESQARIQPFLQPGGTFLEIGPGLGSMSRYLSEYAGRRGKVVAMDIDDRFLGEIANNSPRIEVIHDDVTTYDLGSERFDFIYMRLVLMHLTENNNQLLMEKLTRSLKPGGYLFIDDYVEGANINRFRQLGKIDRRLPDYMVKTYQRMSGHINFDQGYMLAGMMSDAGLTNVKSDISFKQVQGGDNPYAHVMQLSLEQLEPYFYEISEHETLFPMAKAVWMNSDIYWYEHGRAFVVGQKPNH